MVSACCNKSTVAYEQRDPRNNQYHQCVESNFEELEKVWDSTYRKQYGYWRPYVLDVIHKYLDCGDLHQGFARVWCDDCHHEYLLPFSCKKRHFCPSCHQKRVVEFGEHLYEDVMEKVPHRQWVFSIPKRLRPYFMHDRKLLAKLSLCAWHVLSRYLRESVSIDGGKDGESVRKSLQPGCIIAVQTFGEFLNFNPHLHIIATDGCFDSDGKFMKGISPNAADLEAAFIAGVFDMLRKEKALNISVIFNMNTWTHSGFNIYCGHAVTPLDAEGLEKLAQYIVRAPFSQERMTYISENESSDGKAKVVYEGKTTKAVETFTALDWLARLVTHIPSKGEQMVRYYGYYSNKSRGQRKKNNSTVTVLEKPGIDILESDIGRKRFRKNWARLIQKIYNVDPLLCPKCNSKMRVISFIEDDNTIKKILVHLKLWEAPNHDPPVTRKNNMQTSLHLKPHRSFEWWEALSQVVGGVNHDSNGEPIYYDEGIYQAPYEDEYSQLTPYED